MKTTFTYRELAEIIANMTEEQKDSEMSIEDDVSGELIKCNLGYTDEDGTPYFFFPF